jgi:hypothetical protein
LLLPRNYSKTPFINNKQAVKYVKGSNDAVTDKQKYHRDKSCFVLKVVVAKMYFIRKHNVFISSLLRLLLIVCLISGNVDIVNGNLKLILGLIWSLIVRYQIGRSKFPPRKLMLAWLQAVLPECRVSNLTTDWNSGVLLSALVDYCRPGLFSHWRKLGMEAVLLDVRLDKKYHHFQIRAII